MPALLRAGVSNDEPAQAQRAYLEEATIDGEYYPRLVSARSKSMNTCLTALCQAILLSFLIYFVGFTAHTVFLSMADSTIEYIELYAFPLDGKEELKASCFQLFGLSVTVFSVIMFLRGDFSSWQR